MDVLGSAVAVNDTLYPHQSVEVVGEQLTRHGIGESHAATIRDRCARFTCRSVQVPQPTVLLSTSAPQPEQRRNIRATTSPPARLKCHQARAWNRLHFLQRFRPSLGRTYVFSRVMA